MTDSVKLEIKDSVLELIINREDSGNALSNEIIATMNELLLEYRVRSDIKCVFIKGAGEKFFVAGGDLKELISVKDDKETEVMALLSLIHI